MAGVGRSTHATASRAGPGRLALRVSVVVLVTLAILTLAAAWYFAGELTAPPTVRPFEPDNEVQDTADGAVVLADEGWAAIDGRWGLQLPDDRHVVLTDQQATTPDGDVRWGWTDLVGQPPPRVGDPVRVDEFVWVGTPEAVGLAFEEIQVEGPLGALPSWWVAGQGEPVGTVVFVHGRGGTREEALRFLPAMTQAGWNVLVPTYRGDEDAPDWPNGRVRFGTTEWEDVAAAVTSASERSDGPIVPFGVSMGGSLVAQYLDMRDDERIAGVVLDSPLLSFDALLDLQADLNGIPDVVEPVLLPVVQLVADLRHGLDSSRLEQVAADGTFDVPVLLFHGDADDFVPPEPSQRLADVVEDVTFVRMPDAGHVRSWNVDQQRYEQALVGFLDEVVG